MCERNKIYMSTCLPFIVMMKFCFRVNSDRAREPTKIKEFHTTIKISFLFRLFWTGEKYFQAPSSLFFLFLSLKFRQLCQNNLLEVSLHYLHPLNRYFPAVDSLNVLMAYLDSKTEKQRRLYVLLLHVIYDPYWQHLPLGTFNCDDLHIIPLLNLWLMAVFC